MLTENCVLKGHSDRIWHISWRKDGNAIASCSGDRTIRIWKPLMDMNLQKMTWQCVAILEDAQNRTIRACEWSNDGKYIATVSFDATAVIWEDQNGSFDVIASLEGHESEIKSVAWSPSGSYLATCSRDKSVWIWDADPETDFECISVLHGHTQDVKSVKWHPTSDILFSASYDDTIRVWDENEDDWYCKQTLQGHESTVWGITLNAKGDLLASCSDDNTIIIWRFCETSQDVQIDGEPMLWKMDRTLSGFHTRTIYSIDWEPSHNYIVTGAGDDSIRIFHWSSLGDTSTRSQCDSIYVQKSAHGGDVNCVRWSPVRDPAGNLLLASAGDDDALRLWNAHIDI